MLLYILSTLQAVFGVFVIYLTISLLFNKIKNADTILFNSISIVIPFYDEAHNLLELLQSLAQQDYQGLFEIILVNDQSTDDYNTVIASFKKNYPKISLVVIESKFDKSTHLTSKQQAIEKGIEHASFDWIAFTDADMHLGKKWLTSLNASKKPSTAIVYGHTIIGKKHHTLFEALEAFQLEFLFTAAYAFHTAKLPGSCMGNNMLISKAAYNEIGGQSALGYSIVEDRDLLIAAMKKGFIATPAVPFLPIAETAPCRTLNQLFHQTLRWLKGGLSGSFSLLPAILLLGFQNVIFLLSIIGILPVFLTWISLVNFILLAIFTFTGFKKIGSKENILFFPLYYGFLLVETVLMILPVLIISPVWKKRRI